MVKRNEGLYLTVTTRGDSFMRIIEIIVSPKGETTVQTKGYSGSDCLAASKFVELTLGTTLADKKT
jgi:hypothetical protein